MATAASSLEDVLRWGAEKSTAGVASPWGPPEARLRGWGPLCAPQGTVVARTWWSAHRTKKGPSKRQRVVIHGGWTQGGPTLPLQDSHVKAAPVGAPQPPALKPTSTETQTPEVSGLGLGSQLCPGLPWEPGSDRLLGPQFPLLYGGVRRVIPRAPPAWTTIGESDHNWPPLFLSVARVGQAASCSISCRLRDSL